MPTYDFNASAARIAAQVKTGRCGFMTMRKDELRDAFGIGRLTQGLADQLVEALRDQGLFLHPAPTDCGSYVRVYDEKHPIGLAAYAVVAPDDTTEAPLCALAWLHERAKAGEELRSDDVSWLEALDILLQLTIGREPDGWEDLRDDRHGSMLAQELAQSLGLTPTIVGARWFMNLAAAVNSGRPRRRTARAAEMVGSPTGVSAAEDLARVLEQREAQLRETHGEALRAAARSVLQDSAIPDSRVELGALGLRRRIEDKE